MGCEIPEEQLWSWIDAGAPELQDHLARCSRCRALAEQIEASIRDAAAGMNDGGLDLPERIGSYEIKGLLGEGGQGIVYEAEQQSPRRRVALKVLKGGRFVSQRDVRHFQREIQSLAALHHPGIATVFEAGSTEEGQRFFAMELVSGVPLDTYGRRDDLPLEQRLAPFVQACDAVQYAHEQGVIHRDLKPGNILIDTNGQPRIVDFGLARLTESDVTATVGTTETAHIAGTLRYMSPEQVRGESTAIDVRSDVYALGVILYELITGSPPYEIGPFTPEAVRTICEEPPRRPSSVHRAVRGDLEAIACKALEKHPGRRYPSVGALAADLRRYLRGEPVLAKRRGSWRILARRLGQRRRELTAAAVVVVIALAAVEWSSVQRAQRRDAQARRQVVKAAADIGHGRLGPAAEKIAQAAIRGDRRPEAALLLAQTCYWQAKRGGQNSLSVRDGALSGLKASAVDMPEHAWLFDLLRTEILESMGNPEASAVRRVAENAAVDSAEGWYLRSFATLDPRTALRCAETASRHEPSGLLAELVWGRLAHLYHAHGDYEAARRAACTVLATPGAGDRWAWRTFAGKMLVLLGRVDEAAVQYDKAIDLHLHPALSHYNRGSVALLQRRYSDAVTGYSRAVLVEAEPNLWSRYRRAAAQRILRRFDEADEDYRRFCAERGQVSYGEALWWLALMDQARQLRSQEQIEQAGEIESEAATLLDRSVAASSAEPWVHKILLCLAGRLDPAELAEAARQAGGPEARCEACYYAGERCLLDGRPEEARRWFKACLDTGVMVDADSRTLDPMSEWILARWRLDEFGGGAN